MYHKIVRKRRMQLIHPTRKSGHFVFWDTTFHTLCCSCTLYCKYHQYFHDSKFTMHSYTVEYSIYCRNRLVCYSVHSQLSSAEVNCCSDLTSCIRYPDLYHFPFFFFFLDLQAQQCFLISHKHH